MDAYMDEDRAGRLSVAAALRTAADQVVPLSTNRRQNDIRFSLLRIAAELDDTPKQS